MHKAYQKLFGQKMWKLNGIESTMHTVLLDKWDVSGTYPFKITQQETQESTYEYKAALANLSISEKAMLKINMATSYGGIYTGKSIYYGSKKVGTEREKQTVPHEETAVCIQKAYLVSHFEHKLSKTSKKKKEEYNNLNKIIELYKSEIMIYMDEFPERFV